MTLDLDDDELSAAIGSMRAIAPAGFVPGGSGWRALKKLAEERERRIVERTAEEKAAERERRAVAAQKRGSKR